MEQTVERVEAMFKETESGIDYLARRVENEFEHSKKGGNTNPATLLRNLAEIKTEFTSLTQEVQAIQQAQKETVDFIKDQLTTTWNLLQNLEQNSNIPKDGEKPPELVKLEGILGIKLPDPQAVSGAGHSSNPGDGDSGHDSNPGSRDSGQQDTTFTVKDDDQNKSSPCSCPDLSPASKRSQSDEFIELTQAEFDSVSPSIRGRLKLMEVNMVYRLLWRHFKEEKNSGPLNQSDMYKMGLKVSGSNGQAKLKVLKSLNLCTLTRNMEVELV